MSVCLIIKTFEFRLQCLCLRCCVETNVGTRWGPNCKPNSCYRDPAATYNADSIPTANTMEKESHSSPGPRKPVCERATRERFLPLTGRSVLISVRRRAANTRTHIKLTCERGREQGQVAVVEENGRTWERKKGGREKERGRSVLQWKLFTFSFRQTDFS